MYVVVPLTFREIVYGSEMRAVYCIRLKLQLASRVTLNVIGSVIAVLYHLSLATTSISKVPVCFVYQSHSE